MIPGMPETLLPAKPIKSVKCQVQCTGLSSRHVRIFFFMLLNNVVDCVNLVTFSVFPGARRVNSNSVSPRQCSNPKGHNYHDFVAGPLTKYVFVIPPSEEQEKKKA